ncbi:hypothetical protein BJ138DRAFT_79508 [Hygrophoropsis aurantiaca]|uniref:Uncharacterized protein n=1 Tax=Hygrophoropsis aurantiaca TaxID=72124 RepID=A0ACB7ZRU5_9AGAM|nr:hypothetical protein BJ138DRAFT_79508 [Hygrophoropsis aurantiaca]
MFLAITWAQKIYLLTMQAILAIRVYALFNRSKKVLIFLVIFYCLQTIGILVMAGLSYNDRLVHNYLIASNDANTTTQVLDADSSIRLSSQIATILSFAVNTVSDTVLLFFALWAFVRHSLEARTLHGGWSVNVLVKTLVADHLLYFVCNLIWLLLTLINVYLPELPTFTEFLDDAVLIVFNALAVVAGPRMVISLRETENKTRGEGGTWEVLWRKASSKRRMSASTSIVRYDPQRPNIY